MAEYTQRIDVEEDLLDPSKKTLSVKIGESLVASNTKVAELVGTWAKGGSEPLSKVAFRQNVRKLLEKPDAKQIDALFDVGLRQCPNAD